MKIGIDARLYGLENAGLGRYAINLIEELKKAKTKNEYVIFLKTKYHKSLSFPENWKKVEANFQHYGVSEQVRFPKVINNEQIDLMHFLHFNVPLRLNKKFIVTIHDLLMHKQKGRGTTTLRPTTYYLKRAGYKKVFSHAAVKSQRIIVPSVCVKRDLTSCYDLDEQKIDVIYEGVSPMTLQSDKEVKKILIKYKLNKQYFIYAGNAYPHKNLRRVIEAVVWLNKRLKDERDLVQFVIVSARGQFLERVMKITKELNAEKYVKFLGFVEDEDLWSLYRGSLGFVYASLSEGFGLPGLEAMMSGTVVLSSDISVFKEVYKDNVVYFNPYDFSSIERKMRDVLQMNGKKRNEIIKNAKKFASRYSWEKMTKETLETYEKAAG